MFCIVDNEVTRSMWNFPFRLSYRLILREKELHFNIGVYNVGKDVTFSFNLLLHTYFKVPDVRRCQITGLQGCTFVDKVIDLKFIISIHFLIISTIKKKQTRDGAMYQEVRDVVTINEYTDRVYQNTPQVQYNNNYDSLVH